MNFLPSEKWLPPFGSYTGVDPLQVSSLSCMEDELNYTVIYSNFVSTTVLLLSLQLNRVHDIVGVLWLSFFQWKSQINFILEQATDPVWLRGTTLVCTVFYCTVCLLWLYECTYWNKLTTTKHHSGWNENTRGTCNTDVIQHYQYCTRNKVHVQLHCGIYSNMSCFIRSAVSECLVHISNNFNKSLPGGTYNPMVYSSPSLIRPLYLPRNCGHIREVAFGEREKYVHW